MKFLEVVLISQMNYKISNPNRSNPQDFDENQKIANYLFPVCFFLILCGSNKWPKPTPPAKKAAQKAWKGIKYAKSWIEKRKKKFDDRNLVTLEKIEMDRT